MEEDVVECGFVVGDFEDFDVFFICEFEEFWECFGSVFYFKCYFVVGKNFIVFDEVIFEVFEFFGSVEFKIDYVVFDEFFEFFCGVFGNYFFVVYDGYFVC